MNRLPKRVAMAGEEEASIRDDIDRASDLPHCILHHILSFLDTKSAVGTSALSKRWTTLWKEVAVLDRLSQLPDYILHHILSFLGGDARASCRAGALSKRWNNLWKHAFVFDFQAKSLINDDGELWLQDALSSLGSHQAGTIGSVSYEFTEIRDSRTNTRLEIELFDIVVRYLGSCPDPRLRILSIAGRVPFDQLAQPITVHGHREHLTTLKLERFALCPPSAIANHHFTNLTILELRACYVGCGWCSLDDDPFAGLPCLESLKLMHCHLEKPLRVSGLQLVNLEIASDQRPAHSTIWRISRLCAPKLESLYLSAPTSTIWLIDEVSLPCLARAVVRLESLDDNMHYELLGRGYMKMVNSAFVTLLRGLHNVKSLDLCFNDEFPYLQDSPISQMKPVIEDELSRFTRLETLKIQYL